MDQAVYKGPIHFTTFVPPAIKIFPFENRDYEAGETAHQAKPPAARPDGLGLIPRTHAWEERTNSGESSSDRPWCTVSPK